MPKQQPLRRSKAPTKSATAKKNSKETPLTAAEIAFINNTKTPPDGAGMDLKEMYSLLLSMIQQLLTLTESYYTKDSFQKTFGICPNTNKTWMKERGLPYIQLGNIMLYKKSDVDAFFMKYRRVKGKPE
jgi:hypothetical protein